METVEGENELTCEPKFSRVRAAVNVDLTAERYGRRALDCRDPIQSEES